MTRMHTTNDLNVALGDSCLEFSFTFQKGWQPLN